MTRPLLPGSVRAAANRFRSDGTAMFGLIVILVTLIAAVCAPLIGRYDPNATNLDEVMRAPSGSHWLGTDELGRDVFTRLLYGAQTSLTVGLGAVALSVLVGMIIGAVAGYAGGFVDGVMMRLTDIALSIPPLLMGIVFVAILGPSTTSVIIVIAALSWPSFARLVRGEVLRVRGSDYVLASQIAGTRRLRILTGHVLPNIMGPVTVAFGLGIGTAVLTEAGLSFLGLGVRPPQASWGGMVTSALSPEVLQNAKWIWLPPAGMIGLLVLAATFVGDGLLRAVDPRTQS
ncbi:ABC transporter permease [Dactylosporangium sucinum]|uniref:Peptide ABC transporter permease n=1 Tax=Dactylosporangium sucinum TaxID=1424081 RepID=A0A917U6W5_9ACTN|nr:ABC transporter permease [Dactylosporangium sucinum]GGM61903.1 peptide ABC transporter permease [Dactylosporangium sucinum]